MTKVYDIEAEVHMPLSKGYRVKAKIKSLGEYINGIVVFPPDTKSDKWEFRSPAQKVGAKWVSLIEFDTKLPLWRELTEESFRAVREYIESNKDTGYIHHQSNTTDVVIEDIDDEPIDWNSVEIPF